ncbi:MAG: hypothetical protein GY765_34020 [bacterium]|nr:hypothetical protein [bacterium]
MDTILGISVAVACFALLMVSPKLEIKFLESLQLESLTFFAKLIASFLVGFIVFVSITGRVDHIGQRITLIAVSALLIFANIFLGGSGEESG